jgi:hypothetical protein
MICLADNLQIMAFMTNNASNNDTLVEKLRSIAGSMEYHLMLSMLTFGACHTVHLAAIKVICDSFDMTLN